MRFRFNRDTTAKDQQRTLGQLQMLQAQSAGPPSLADSRAGCGKDRVIIGQGGQPPVRMRHCICSILSMQPVTGQFQTSFGTQKRKDGKLNALAFQVEIVSSNRRRIYQASLHRRLPERPLSARRAVFRCNRKTNRSALANTLPNAFHGTSPR